MALVIGARIGKPRHTSDVAVRFVAADKAQQKKNTGQAAAVDFMQDIIKFLQLQMSDERKSIVKLL